MTAFLPIFFIAWPSPTVVVVLPSPAGVGLMAVTSTSLPVGTVRQPGVDRFGQLGLVAAVGLQLLRQDPQAVGDFMDGQHGRRLRDLDVSLHGYGPFHTM